MGALRDFVADLLESEGAAIEPAEPDGLDVLVPEPLRATMGWPELARLGFGATLPTGAMPIRLEGDWLDRFEGVLGERGRWAERQLAADTAAAPSDPERLISSALDLPNAVWRLHDTKPAWTRCLLLAFRYTAISDEKREGLVWLGFNQGTGAAMGGDFLARLRTALADAIDWHVPTPDTRRAAGAPWDPTALSGRVRPLIEHHARRDLDPFLNAMRRRLDRDRGQDPRVLQRSAPDRTDETCRARVDGRRQGGGRPQARDHADRRHRARICRQASVPAPTEDSRRAANQS